MEKGKDVFTVFREGGRRLSVQPSAGAWQKLESRLDAQQQRGKVVAMRRWLSAAAAVVILVGGLLWWSSNSRLMRDNPAPQFLEELTGTGSCQPYCLLLEARKDLPAYYANPVRRATNE